MRKTIFLAILLCSVSLSVGCSNEVQNQVTVSKLKSRNEYQSIAYKKEINHQKAEKLLGMLARNKQGSQVKQPKVHSLPSYKLYFNMRSGKDKLIVHSIWLKNRDEAVVKQNATYLTLSKKDTKYMVEFLSGIE